MSGLGRFPGNGQPKRRCIGIAFTFDACFETGVFLGVSRIFPFEQFVRVSRATKNAA